MDISFFRHRLNTKKTKEIPLYDLYAKGLNYFEYRGYHYVLVRTKNRSSRLINNDQFHCINLKSCTEIYLSSSTLVRPIKVTIELEKDLELHEIKNEIVELKDVELGEIKATSSNNYYFSIII